MQETVREYVTQWSNMAPPQFVLPDLQDAISFMVTEAGESLDEVLRQKSYVRNNPAGTSRDKLMEEIADTVFMAYVAAIVVGGDLNQALADKLKKMDALREKRAQRENAESL